jgi:hypothetical protein
MTDWNRIDDPENPPPRWPDQRNFLVCGWFADLNYMTDPWVVFRDMDGSFCRWPHDRRPTFWAHITMPSGAGKPQK